MERLTEKGKEYKTLEGKARHLATINCISKAELRNLYCKQYDALQKLEDLEEQIGMSLLELFIKVLGKDIYYLDDDYCDECRVIGIQLVTKNETIFSFTSTIPDNYDYIILTDSCWTFRVRDYGKSWFLDEEEAEKKLEEMNDKKVE